MKDSLVALPLSTGRPNAVAEPRHVAVVVTNKHPLVPGMMWLNRPKLGAPLLVVPAN